MAFKPGILHMMIGPSGAGKSTYIKTVVRGRVIDRRWVVSSDDLREEITGDPMDQSANRQVFAAMHSIIHARIVNGLVAFVDATNINTRDRFSVRNCAPDNARIVYHVVDRPLADKHRTAGWRADVRINGLSLIDYHHEKFQKELQNILLGDDDQRVTVLDMRIM